MPSQPAPMARGVSLAGRAARLVVIAALAAGCAAGGLPLASTGPAAGSPAASMAARPDGPTIVPTGNAAVQVPPPVPTLAPTPDATDPSLDGPGGDPPPTDRPSLPPGPAIPPPLSLVLPNGGTVAGALGGYTWRGAGSDAPWIVPPPPRAVRTAGPYGVSVDPSLAIDAWRAAWAPVVDETIGDVAGWDEGTGRPIGFTGPTTPGSWGLSLDIRFADGSRAAWYWRLEAGV